MSPTSRKELDKKYGNIFKPVVTYERKAFATRFKKWKIPTLYNSANSEAKQKPPPKLPPQKQTVRKVAAPRNLPHYQPLKNNMETELEILKRTRAELVETISELDPDASKVEIYELHGEISEIDRKIHAIDPSQV